MDANITTKVDFRRTLIRFIIDVLNILLFVVIGQINHDQGLTLSGIAKVAAPFLIGLACAWLIFQAWRKPKAIATGIKIWLFTTLFGLVLRNVVFSAGTATSFVIVTTLTLGVLFVGSRLFCRKIIQ